MREDWREWLAGARIHPGWANACIMGGIFAFESLKLGLIAFLLLCIPVVLTCRRVAEVNRR